MNYGVEININGLEDVGEALNEISGALSGIGAGGAALGTALGGFTALAGIMYVFSLVFGLAQYIMNAVAYMRMAKKVGVKNGWLAFIPIADLFILGKIADTTAKKKNNAKRLLVSQIIVFVLVIVLAVCTAIVGISAAMAIGTSEITALTVSMIPFALVLIGFSVAAVFVAVYVYIAQYYVCEIFGGKNRIYWFLGIILGGMLISSIIPPVLLLILSFCDAKKDDPEEPIPVIAEEN